MKAMLIRFARYQSFDRETELRLRVLLAGQLFALAGIYHSLFRIYF